MFDSWLVQYGTLGVIMATIIGAIILLYKDNKNIRIKIAEDKKEIYKTINGVKKCINNLKPGFAVMKSNQENLKEDISEIKDTQTRIFDKVDDLHNECVKLNKR